MFYPNITAHNNNVMRYIAKARMYAMSINNAQRSNTMVNGKSKKAKAQLNAKVKAIKATLKAHGSKDTSHVKRALAGGWRKGSACYYIQARLNMPTEKIAKAIMKTEFKNQSAFSTLSKATARINTIKAQAKMLHIRKA